MYRFDIRLAGQAMDTQTALRKILTVSYACNNLNHSDSNLGATSTTRYR